MKYVFISILLYNIILADTVPKTWIITNENNIQSTEDDLKSPTEGISLAKNIDDIPLAKTYPVDQVPVKDKIVTKSVQSKSSKEIKKNIQQRIDEIKSVIDAEVQKIKATQRTAFQPVEAIKPNRPDQKTDKSEPTNSHNIKVISSLTKTIQENPKLLILIAMGSLLLISLFLIIFRRKKKFIDDKYSIAKDDEAIVWILETFAQLKGEVRHQYIKRKQNILFNDDFTHYQKAKALNELETEYTDLEFIYLPKLFSVNFSNFMEGKRVLSDKPELREIIQDFIEATLAQKPFTKLQKEQILKNMKGKYRTGEYIWKYDHTTKEDVPDKENSYLLQ